MNANQLLDAFGGIRDDYVLSAVNSRRPAATPRRPKRLMMIAAIAAAMLLLAGCAAAYVLHLQDMKAGEQNITKTRNEYGREIDPTEVTVELYTPHALKDTPIQKATMEWQEFLSQYDPDHPQVSDEDIPQKFKISIPANYTYTYNCSTPEKAMKLDEITAKYNLKLLDMELLAQGGWQKDIMLEALGISGVTRPAAEARVLESGGYFYPNGNFRSDLDFTLWNEDVAWTSHCFAEFHYAKKDTFDPQVSTTFAGQYEQWNYTAADGTPVLLVLESSGAGQVYADAGDATIFIELNPWTVFDDEKPTKKAIEQMADVFDYRIRPASFDLDAVRAKLAAAEEKFLADSTECSSYAEFLNQLDWLGRYSYLLLDLNGDGVDELILDSSGWMFQIYAIKNGEVALNGGKMAPYIFCEGGYIVSDQEVENAREKYTSFHVSQYTGTGYTSFKEIERLLHHADGTWEHTVGNEYEGTEISEEEAQAIMKKYIPLDVSFAPVTNFPMDKNGTTLGQMIASEPRPSSEEVRRLYEEFAAGDSSILQNARYFALRDMNRDGIDELLLGSEPDSIDYIMSVYRGRVADLRRTYKASLCEGNVLDIGESYDHEEKGRVQEYRFHYLYDEHRGRDLGHIFHNLDSDTWEDQDGKPISAEDAQALIAKYPRIDPGMRPISELRT